MLDTILNLAEYANVMRRMQVEKADKAVKEGNQNRSAMSSSMMQRLKKASADYEVRTSFIHPCLILHCLPWIIGYVV